MVRERENYDGGLFPFPVTAACIRLGCCWRNCEITEWEEGEEIGGSQERRRDESPEEYLGRKEEDVASNNGSLTFCPRFHYLAHHPVPVLIDPDDLEVDFECK